MLGRSLLSLDLRFLIDHMVSRLLWLEKAAGPIQLVISEGRVNCHGYSLVKVDTEPREHYGG